MGQAAEYVHDEPNLLPLFDAQPLSVGNKVKVSGQVHIAQDLSPRKKMSLQRITNWAQPYGPHCDHITFISSAWKRSDLGTEVQTPPPLRSSFSSSYSIGLRVTVSCYGIMQGTQSRGLRLA